MTNEEKDILIANQQKQIETLLKVGNLNQQLIVSWTNALRLHMLDMTALLNALGQKAPTPQDFSKDFLLFLTQRCEPDKTN